MELELERLIGDGEEILWKGIPDKKCFIFECIFNRMLPFALFWGIGDFSIIAGRFSSTAEDFGYSNLMFLGFMILHLFPVWIYLGGIISTIINFRNTEYVVTDKNIYISSGIISVNRNTIPIDSISNIEVHRGFFDQKLDVGDVNISTFHQIRSANGSYSSRGTNNIFKISDIENYNEVHQIIQSLINKSKDNNSKNNTPKVIKYSDI